MFISIIICSYKFNKVSFAKFKASRRESFKL
jgi:hypothetical protein